MNRELQKRMQSKMLSKVKEIELLFFLPIKVIYVH